ncbi:4-hydroxy-tetrahydrodipicolinate synthase, chloroplastic-like [Lotus japonicus]|uniref:4-hydroxy-tetrahydrodipicolinate synthase, chloroplastic-like n=1 Tax=Lotus japonicus TaxID=34305 RepID=UPI002582B037|nr:4-hydroxy-tetrahydrodipicolinate synthase, chloroplastic-like [Lotus japonicus]
MRIYQEEKSRALKKTRNVLVKFSEALLFPESKQQAPEYDSEVMGRDLSQNLRNESRWSQAAVLPSFHCPMSISDVKMRTSIEKIRSLRLITAIKTPYLPNGQIDLEAYDNLVNFQIAHGIEGIIVAGTTGEGQLMSLSDKIMLIGHTVHNFGDKVKVIGNTGSNSTSQAISITEQGFAVGMHVALQINPYYGRTSMDGLIAHYNSLLSIGPVIIYNIPSRTSQDVPPSVVETLAPNPNFVGVKECGGIDRVKLYADKGIVVWTANQREMHDGAIGDMSAVSNLVPGLMRELMCGGKNPSLSSKLETLFDWFSLEPIPIALNTALAQLGVTKPVFRLPFVPLPQEKRVEFAKLVKEMGREHFVGEKDVEVLDDHDFIIVDRY